MLRAGAGSGHSGVTLAKRRGRLLTRFSRLRSSGCSTTRTPPGVRRAVSECSLRPGTDPRVLSAASSGHRVGAHAHRRPRRSVLRLHPAPADSQAGVGSAGIQLAGLGSVPRLSARSRVCLSWLLGAAAFLHS